jgi:hypothetical protein
LPAYCELPWTYPAVVPHTAYRSLPAATRLCRDSYKRQWYFPMKPLRHLTGQQGPQGNGQDARSASVRTSGKKRYNHSRMLGGDVQPGISLMVAADSGGAVLALPASPQAWRCPSGRSDARVRIRGADRRVVVAVPVLAAVSRSIGDPAAALMDRLDGPHLQKRGCGSAGLLALARNPGHVRLLVRLR